jgi:hypothetical protein
VGRLDIPLDASPKYRERCERIKRALEKHGAHNTYFLYNGGCKFHLTNRDDDGMLEFRFEGTAITGADDMHAQHADLAVELVRETATAHRPGRRLVPRIGPARDLRRVRSLHRSRRPAEPGNAWPSCRY